MELSYRLKYGDLNEKYRNDVLASFDHFERDAMISAVNVICGNIEIECASAINSLSNSGKVNFSVKLIKTIQKNIAFVRLQVWIIHYVNILIILMVLVQITGTEIPLNSNTMVRLLQLCQDISKNSNIAWRMLRCMIYSNCKVPVVTVFALLVYQSTKNSCLLVKAIIWKVFGLIQIKTIVWMILCLHL